MTACDHPSFTAKVDVNRLTETDGGPVNAFAADVRISCDVCGEPFEFLCPDGGVLPDRPAISPDGQEIRLPIVPSNEPERYRPNVGFRVTGWPQRPKEA